MVREHPSICDASLDGPADGRRRFRVGDQDVIEPRPAVLVAGERRVREVEVAGEDASLVWSGPRIDERTRPHEFSDDDVRHGIRRVQIGDDAELVDADSMHDPPLPALVADLHSAELGRRKRPVDQDRVRLPRQA